MSHAVNISVEFANSPHDVYEALCDMGKHPNWNSGLTSISHTGRMYEGLTYTTSSNLLGRVNKANILVVKMIPDQSIVLESRTSLLEFHAEYDLKKITADSCELTCNLRFTISTAVFKLAESTIVSVAESRVRGDLEALRASLAHNSLN